MLAASAAAFGLVSSLHCVAMCGPIAAAAAPPGSRGPIATYQVARIASYTALGASIGATGEGALAVFGAALGPIAGVLAAGAALVVAALALRAAGLPALVSRASAAKARSLGARSPHARAALLGGVTPMLPCGLAYGLFALSAATGAAISGATLAFAFAVASAPGLLVSAALLAWARRALGPSSAALAQRALLFGAAGVVLYRAVTMQLGVACH